MLTLTLSTSSAKGSVCIARDSKVLAYEFWHKQTSHSEVITQRLESLLKTAGVSFAQIQQLICTTGPGSFTGLRVGLSVTRSLAYSLKIPIISINDGWAIALNEPATKPTSILVAINAQKNKVFAGLYQKHLNEIKEVLPPTLLSASELASHLVEPSYLVMGDGVELISELLDDKNKFALSASSEMFPDAKNIFNFAHATSFKFPKISWNELLPMYLRASAAEEVRAEKLGKK